MESSIYDFVTNVGVVGVLAFVVKWLLTNGKETLDKQSESQKLLAKSIDNLADATKLHNNTLERIESKLDNMYADVKELRHSIRN